MTAQRILIPEGSSLSAREAIAALGKLSYIIDVLDPDPLCLCRFSKFVRHFYQSPRLSDCPDEFEKFLLAHLSTHSYDLVLPVHEHSFLLAAIAEEIKKHSPIAVAPFNAFDRLQSKVQFFNLLNELHLPHPPTQIIASPAEFPMAKPMPFYVKTAFGTAGDGTWRLATDAARLEVLNELRARELVGNLGPFLVQDIMPGALEVVQSIFRKGELIAVHEYRQQIEGVGGSASGRISVQRPTVIVALRRLGESLAWHGALMLDYIFNDATGEFWFIDPNPRLGETMNAVMAGNNLSQTLVRLTLGDKVPWSVSKNSVRSHILLTALLATAVKERTRRAVLREMLLALRRHGHYTDSREEVASIRNDLLSIVPMAFIAMRILLRPGSAHVIVARAIQNYALSEHAANFIRASRRLRHENYPIEILAKDVSISNP